MKIFVYIFIKIIYSILLLKISCFTVISFQSFFGFSLTKILFLANCENITASETFAWSRFLTFLLFLTFRMIFVASRHAFLFSVSSGYWLVISYYKFDSSFTGKRRNLFQIGFLFGYCLFGLSRCMYEYGLCC